MGTIRGTWGRTIQRLGRGAGRRVSHLARRVVPAALLTLMLWTGFFVPFAQAGIGVGTAHAAGVIASQGSPNTFDPHTTATSVLHLPQVATGGQSASAGPPQPIARGMVWSMAPGSVALRAGQATQFVGSDGAFEVDVPAGAVTPGDLAAAAGGMLRLQVTQIAPASGTNAGGSGLVSFGTYLIQVVDGDGLLVAHGLRAPVTLILHYGAHDNAVDMTHAFVVVNTALPTALTTATVATTSAPAAAFHAPARTPEPPNWRIGRAVGGAATPTPPPPATPITQQQIGLGARQSLAPTADLAHHQLTVMAGLSSPSTSMSWNTDAPVATFGKPDPFAVDLNAGGLTAGIPLDVPAGPGGLTPPITLGYSSDAVSEQHNPQGAAGWTGAGWNLGLGAISWAEHNMYANCPPGGTNCPNSPLWESTWQLSDAFGTSAELIPPNVNVATYYDDTTNTYCNATYQPTQPYLCPIQWHTAPESHAKVWAYVGPVVPQGMGVAAPCFRVWLPNGIMEEFGCTSDSLQYYYIPGNGDYLANWLLDLITDPQGNQIHVTYQSDSQTKSYNNVNYTYQRDVVPATVEWDAPGCRNAQAACTGAAWAPLMRVNFAAGHTPSRLSNSPTGCNTGSNYRCDDPLDLSGSGGLVAPEVQSTFALNDAQVQVRNSGTASWNTLMDYQFTYQQSGPTTITDPTTGKQESTAGQFLLTQLAEVGDDGNTRLPTRTFGYTSLTQYYEDDTFQPNPTTNCGPSWNTGNGNGCILWSQSYAANSSYLSSASNRMGLAQSFSWANARNNTHAGSNSWASNPLYCNTHQTGYPCNETDDQDWSHAALVQESDAVQQAGSGGNVTVTSTTAYTYFLTTNLVAQECGDCTTGMYWGDQDEGDYLDYYNGKFMGFAEADVSNPDGSLEKHKYYTTEGWGVYDTSQITICPSNMQPIVGCHNAPYWHLMTAAHGHEFEADYYATDGVTLLKKTTASYAYTCPPSGVSGTPPSGTYGNWGGNLVSESDPRNPVAACDIQTLQTDAYTEDGSNASGVPDATTQYTYDSYGRVMEAVTSSNDGGATGSLTTLVAHSDYIWNDAVTATKTSATGTYLIDYPNLTYTRDSANSAHYGCAYTAYDGQAWSGGQQSGLMLGETTRVDHYSGCGTPGNGYGDATGQMTTTHTYDQWGNPLTTTTPDANAGVSGHVGCTVGGTQYSVCDAYDTTFDVLSVSSANALNQTSGTGYGSQTDPTGGFGLWPVSTTDANHQTTSYAYDALGRMTGQTLPGEGNGLVTESWSYTDWCNGTAAQTPCVELDQTQRLDSLTTVTTRAFYDGLGRLVETRTPGSGGQDVVRYRNYDVAGRDVFDSEPYFVTAYTGGPGAAAFATPNSAQVGTTTTYDGLGRVTQVKDPNSNITSTSYTVVCNAPGTGGDSACYEQTLVADPLAHQSGTLTDALGRADYAQRYTGNSQSTYALYTTTKESYDYLGNLTALVQPNGTSTTSYTYDQAGRKTGMSDPDRGTESYSYDQDSNLTKSVDARGASGTVYAGYDGLDRQIWRNTSNGPTGAYVSYSYDSTAGGNQGVGRLTGESFSGGPNNSLSGSYAEAYDARGQQTALTITVGGTAYPTSQSYDDAGLPLQATYPDGSTATLGYDGAGEATTLTSLLHGSQTSTYVVSGATYQPSGQLATLAVGGTPGAPLYTESFGYDNAERLTTEQATLAGQQTAFYALALGYDASSNVTQTTTTLPAFGSNPAGTDSQSFCYDEFNRLVWAGTTGTPTGPAAGSCGPVPGGTTLSGAGYTASYAYDTLDRLTSGPGGSYNYGDASHLHALTATSNGHGYAYDAAGNATCRTTSSSTPCSGTPAGAVLAYDNEGRLAAWQNTPTSPTTTDAFLYDGSGQRVAQQVTASGSTTTTVYVGSLAEYLVRTSTTWRKYYTFAGRLVADNDGVFNYLQSDQEGTPQAQVSATGAGESGSLRLPYGSTRYGASTFMGDLGFTGQRKDSTPNLVYFNARYYDQDVGVFVSADTVTDGLNRYAYVGGNPETNVDPSGHLMWTVEDHGGDLQGMQYLTDSREGTGWAMSWNTVKSIVQFFTGGVALYHDARTLFDPHASFMARLSALGDATNQIQTDLTLWTGLGVAERSGEALAESGGGGTTSLADAGDAPSGDAGETALCSFSADTLVATPGDGEQPIGSLQVGDAVEAYNPATGSSEPETVQHVWINHDHDLLDVILHEDGQATAQTETQPKTQQAATKAHGSQAPPTDETIHTTTSHPWLTSDRGWVQAGDLHPGERVVRLDGSTATVAALAVRPGAADYYNLTVSQLHTYAVGAGRLVVHNTGPCFGTEIASRSLKDLAAEVRTSGLHPAAVNQRTIAVGADSEGSLFAGSSNGFDAGQRAALERLGIQRVPGSGSLHAEEELLRGVPNLKRVGTSVRDPCGPDEHNCALQLFEAGVEVEP